MRLRAVLLALTMVLPAQAQVVLKTYYAEDLVKTPGLIEVSPGFTTVIDFWDTVDAAFSARRELLRLEGGGSRLLLSTGMMTTQAGAVPVKSGMTDLVVEVGGRTLLFTVRIGPGEYPRRYQILLKRTQGGTYAPLSQVPSTPLMERQPVQSSPPASSPAPSPQAHAQPPAVHFTTTVEAPSGEEGKVSVFFTLENRGSHPVSFAINDLQVLQEGKPLRFEMRRDPLKAVLNPGEGQSGVIVVHGARPGEVLLRWRGVELGPGRSFFLERRLLGKTIEVQTEGR
ncbi:hypothetical protein TthHB5008_b22170 (plasmid) [Thermus thermophilus]|uniref:hypothetical protein n=1 Tax=Thermus thermophilus TaxID=274 RepID=UPI00192D0542|nr:hypothetical protein [Thermus thermophilus]BCP99145.1 hypothetical protein TthHB5002_b22480 [Thermus thermophilus]BCQ01447.1 hypothetical protein TthHB5008_b22170 [Thermus thermophilus]